MSTEIEGLRALLKTLSVSQAKVQAVAKLALKNSQQYKQVVYSIERHITKAPAPDRLAGLYVIDAIVRGVSHIPALLQTRAYCASHAKTETGQQCLTFDSPCPLSCSFDQSV